MHYNASISITEKFKFHPSSYKSRTLVNILKGHSKFNMKFKAMLPKSVKTEKGNAMWVIFFFWKLKSYFAVSDLLVKETKVPGENY